MLKNQILQKAFNNIQAKAQDPAMFQRLVQAGRKIIYDQGMFQKLSQQLHKSQDPAGDVARGMVVVLKLMSTRARGTIPPGSLVQAGMALVLDALDFLEQSGLVKVDSPTLDRAVQDYVEALLPAVGLSHDRMNQTLGQIKQVMADPQKMAAYRQSMGGAAQ